MTEPTRRFGTTGTTGDGPRLGLALALCWGLFVFDVALGGTAAFWPERYLAILHPGLDTPQVELVRRTGMIWLMFAAVALRAATAAPATRGRWFLVLAVLRLLDVPADLAYAASMSGTTGLGRGLVLAAPPLNLALGGYFYALARRLLRG
jgi:hypothetical protein